MPNLLNKILEYIGKAFLIVITIFLTIFYNDIRTYFGITTQYRLIGKTVLILLLALTLTLIISFFNSFFKKHESKLISNESKKVPKKVNQKQIVKYVKYDIFRWKVSYSNDKYIVSRTPICLICCIPITLKPNEFCEINYKCAKCNTNYNKYNISQIRDALILELQTHGFKRMKTVYKKPC